MSHSQHNLSLLLLSWCVHSPDFYCIICALLLHACPAGTRSKTESLRLLNTIANKSALAAVISLLLEGG